MSIIAKDNGGDFEPIPVGLHRAICINVFDVGMQPGYQGAAPAHKVVVLWEIEPKSQRTGKRFTITQIYTLSISERSRLGADLMSWRGKPFTEEEKKGFDLVKIKRVACQLNIVPNGPNGDRVKIASVLPAQRLADESGRMSVTPHWQPETGEQYIPSFVTKMKENQVQKQPQTYMKETDDGFTDEIPF